MTNRKIKDYHKNKLCFSITVENFKNLCRILLTLNRLYPKTFYPKKIEEWIQEYVGSCEEMDKYDRAGAYEYKMDQLSEAYGIDTGFCKRFVAKNNPSITDPKNQKVLMENIRLALVHTCSEFGIGAKRLNEIVEALSDEQPTDPFPEMKKLGMEMYIDETKLGDIDYRKLKPAKQRETTFTDLKRGYAELEGLRAYQEAVMKAESH